ncbi:MAG: glycogen debranching protein [Candidatus Rokuibacteriota bacterium]
MPRRGSRSATVQPAQRGRSIADREAAAPAGIRAARASWASLEGLPIPLGVSWIAEEDAWNFAVYSEHAKRVTLLLYTEEDPSGPVLTRRLDHLRNKSGPVWHCRVPATDMKGARFYAYQAEGPRSPRHPFDADKILFDPYARALHFPPGFDRQAAIGPGANAGRAPLGLIGADRERFDWADDRRPGHEADAVIYELHVRGFTAHPSSGVADGRRGTFAGLIDKIPYLIELGVTVVELMPVFQFDPQEGNYWGYNPISFFAPNSAYANRCAMCEQHTEFRELVRALHAAGLEVVLDVVYNHTGEGSHAGPVYSFKGLDNDTYYILSGRADAPYADFSGTGNTLNFAHRYVRRMVLDSLRYWAREMRVDGFRFDLASVFARRSDGSLSYEDPPIFGDIASDPDLAGLRLIAEPWDAGGAYQLGRAFPGVTWAQWNGRFRDDVRRFVRGDAGMVPSLMRRLYGSDDLFPDDRASAYHAYQSVNYVTSHDGFTLWDLVSYDAKRNRANGHDNRDGTDDNLSWNCGWEGDEGVPTEVVALRKRQAKNFLCLLLLANGTPMLRAGDEFLHTQGGNNNPYNQDNETSWLDWSRLDVHRDVLRFARLMIAFRKAHPSLCRSRFWRHEVHWYGVGSSVDLSHGSRSCAYHLSGASQGDDDLYVIVNMYWEPLEFAVQEGRPSEWQRAVDTGQESPDDVREPGRGVPLSSLRYTAGPRSVVVLVRQRGSEGRR